MSTITVPCRCGRILKVANELAGKSCTCSKCGERVNVPGIVGKPASKNPTAKSPDRTTHEPASDKIVVKAELACPACAHRFTKSFGRAKQQTLCPECNATLLARVDLVAESVESVELLEPGMPATRSRRSGPIDTRGRGALQMGLRVLSRSMTILAAIFAGLGFPSLGITLGMAFCLMTMSNPSDAAEAMVVAAGIGCLMIAMTVITFTYYLAEEHVVTVAMFFLGSTAYVGSGFLARFSVVLAFIGLIAIALVVAICVLALLVGLICALIGARGDREFACLGGAFAAALGAPALLLFSAMTQPTIPARLTEVAGQSPQTYAPVVLAAVLAAAAHPLFVVFLANVARRFGSPETADAVKTYLWSVLGLTGFTILVVLLSAALRPPPELVLLATAILLVTEVVRQFWSIWVIRTVHDLIQL
jgi:hypothetical protein